MPFPLREGRQMRKGIQIHMKTTENRVDKRSDYFINSPSGLIMDTFLYPTYMGHYFYLSGYRLHRTSFDSFLLMYVMEGSLTLEYKNRKINVGKDTFLMIDCYQEHCYYSTTGWEATWIHFDGFPARRMYDMITDKLGNIFMLDDPLPVLNGMAKIYHPYSKKEPVNEILISRYLYNLLTDILVYTPPSLPFQEAQRGSSIENVKIYIRDHIQESLKIEALARVALMSPYHFMRVFKKETGMSPHEYVINYRIRLAKMLLLETTLSVNDICYESGFSSESVFCAAFKKNVGITPTSYRKERT